MAFNSAQVTRLIAGSYNYSPTITQWSTPVTIDMLDVTTINDTAKQFIVGMDSATLAVTGYLDTDGAAGALLSTIDTWRSTPTALMVAPSGLTVGNELVLAQANESNFTPGTQVGAVVGYTLAAQVDGPAEIGVSLHALGAETANSNSASVDNTAATANGGIGQVHVTAYSGLTNIVVKVQHSVDNSTWADLVTFTTITGKTSERSVVASGTTVRRYLRSLWTVTGTGSCTFAVGFARR